MKRIQLYTGFLFVLFSVSCTKDFDAVNTDPTRASAGTFDPNLLLPQLEFNFANGNVGYSGSLLFQSMWVQLMASTSSGSANYYSNADKYLATTGTLGYVSSDWNNMYTVASNAYEIQNLTSENALLGNLNAVAGIMKVASMQYVTDVYGDVPYKQALQAKTAAITLPAYDKQQDIYNSMFTELDAAIAKLDATKGLPTNDVMGAYKGNVAQWKKFGYSLMLKLAMRLTKVDAATAQKYAEKAIAGGTMASVADDAYVRADDAKGFSNANATALAVAGDIYEARWSKTYIDYLKANADPRLGVIAEVPKPGLLGSFDPSAGTSDPAVQIGMPNGYDLAGGATDITKSPGYPGASGSGADVTPIGKYSRPKSSLYRNRSGVLFVLTYAETELLKAEAAARGWSAGGTAAAHYKNGLSAGLQSLAQFGADAVITAAAADAYATTHPLDVTSMANSLKQINEQFWATEGSLMNFVEAWNNWRRSGYPVLAPVNYPGNFSNGTIPRRQTYPASEATLNPEGYKAAVAGLTGGDTWSARVWWDK